MIQEKDFLYRVPVKTAPITTPKGQIRNPEILVDIEGGEFMHGNILDANSTNKLINQSVKEAVDNKIIEGGYVTKDLLNAETSARTNGDEDLSAKIKAEQTRAEGKEKEISDKLAIVDGDSNTEGSFRKAIADVIAAAPEDLDTLKEIADKLSDNDDLYTVLNQAITEKADASALSNYVLTTALNQQVDTLNAAISAKQDAGNYIPYDKTITSRYKIDKDLMIDNSDGSAVLGISSISAISNSSNSEIQINPSGITMRSNDDVINLDKRGIILPDGDYDHVLTSNGSTLNITQYVKNSDISGQINAKADRSDLIALEQKVAANTTAITNVTTSKGIPYDPSVENVYSTDKDLAVKINDQSTAVFGPTSCISLKNAGINTLSLTYGGLQCKIGDQNKIDINPNTINQVTSAGYILNIDPDKIKQVASNYTFDVNSSDVIKWSRGDIYTKIDPNGLDAKVSNDKYARYSSDTYIDIMHAYNQYVLLTPNIIKTLNDDKYFELNQYLGTMQCLLGTSDDSVGFKLSCNGLRIGEKADINVDNGELISISRQHNTIPYIFKVKDNTIETNKVKIDEFGLTNDKPSTGNSSHALYITNSALHGAILVEHNADLSIGYDNSILERPFWKFGMQGAEFNGSDDQKRIYIQTGGFEYANIFGIKLSNNVFNSNSHIDNPCEIQNDIDYVSFSKKIKVSDIITDATTDSSLNTVLSKKVDTDAFNSFASSISGQLNSFNGALSTFGGQIALKQDKITVNSVDVTDIETDDITKLRTIVKDLIDALSESGLIRKNINLE